MEQKIRAAVEGYLEEHPVSQIPISLEQVYQKNGIWNVELSTTADTYGDFDDSTFTNAVMDYISDKTGEYAIVFGLQRDKDKSKLRRR